MKIHTPVNTNQERTAFHLTKRGTAPQPSSDRTAAEDLVNPTEALIIILGWREQQELTLAQRASLGSAE